MTSRGKLPQPDSPEQILHDFAVSLHDYANGRANGLVYGEQLSQALTKLSEYYTNKFLELLKDEGAAFDDKYKLMYVGVRNELRAELRQAIKKLGDNNADQ